MCEVWTDQEWLEKSQPANPDSRYTLVDTRYDANGKVARTYQSSGGAFWAVLPGKGNDYVFHSYDDDDDDDPQDAHMLALDFLARKGYIMPDPPAPTTPIDEVIEAAGLVLAESEKDLA